MVGCSGSKSKVKDVGASLPALSLSRCGNSEKSFRIAPQNGALTGRGSCYLFSKIPLTEKLKLGGFESLVLDDMMMHFTQLIHFLDSSCNLD